MRRKDIKMWKKIKKFIIDWIWQLPQNICGIVWRSIKKDDIIIEVGNGTSYIVGAKVYLMRSKGGVTLGKFIFISQTYLDQSSVIKHECGHVRQSKILGPLYLIIIGIPSILHAALNGYIGCCKNNPNGYYHFFTEHWANKLMEKY